MDGWMMQPAQWGIGYALVMFAMWWVMMIAMMLPVPRRFCCCCQDQPQEQGSRRTADPDRAVCHGLLGDVGWLQRDGGGATMAVGKSTTAVSNA